MGAAVPVPVAFPAESRGRMRGQRGRAAHVPPRHDAHSAGNSPEPSGPPSARAGTGRKPRGTVNPAARARRAPPRQSSLPGTRHGGREPLTRPQKSPNQLTKWCMSPLPLCEVITRRSGLRLLAASWAPCEGGGGGGDLAGMILPKVLPLETGRRPGEARALT